MAIIDNLISYYKLDESSGSVLDAHGSNTGTNNGATPSATGKINTAYDFDGTNDYVAVPLLDDLLGDQTYSVGGWFNADTISGGRLLWSVSTGGVDLYVFVLADGKLRFQRGGTFGDTTASQFSTGSFIHVFAVYTSSSNVKVYVDGVFIEDLTVGTSPSFSSGNINIGNYWDDQLTSFAFDGKIDEFGVWSRALTSTEISDLYNSGNGLAYPFSAATLRLIKIAGTFQEKPILTKVAGVFVDKPIKIKIGGTFVDA